MLLLLLLLRLDGWELKEICLNNDMIPSHGKAILIESFDWINIISDTWAPGKIWLDKWRSGQNFFATDEVTLKQWTKSKIYRNIIHQLELKLLGNILDRKITDLYLKKRWRARVPGPGHRVIGRSRWPFPSDQLTRSLRSRSWGREQPLLRLARN